MWVLRALFFFILLAGSAEAAIKYVSPTGSGSTCSEGSPCNIEALETLPVAGDTWRLQSGTYNDTYLNINCAASAANGTSGAHITIMADVEGGAIVRSVSTTSRVLEVFNCAYYDFTGIVWRGAAAPTAGLLDPNNAIWFASSTDITWKKSIVYETRGGREHTFFIQNSHRVVVEDSMMLRYTSHGVVFYGGSENRVRRLYCNPRDFMQTTDVQSGLATGDCSSLYQNTNSIIENSVSEGNYQRAGCFSVGQNTATTATGNQMIGNICLDGFIMSKGYDNRGSPGILQRNVTISNNLIYTTVAAHVGPPAGFRNGIYLRNTEGATVNSNTIIGMGTATADGQDAGFRANTDNWVTPPNCEGGANLGFAISNMVLIGDSNSSTDLAFWTECVTQYVTRTATYVATLASSFQTLFTPDDGNITNKIALASDPYTTSGCRVFSPVGSALEGSGPGGANMGAQILYAYVDGTLQTNTKLWNPATKKWAGGAAPSVAGISDTDSIYDIEARLHPTCTTWPTDYTGGTPPFTGTVNVTQATVAGGVAISVEVTVSSPGTVGDWVGLYPAGGGHMAFFDTWKYLSGTQTKPGSPVLSTTLSMMAPNPIGDYEARLYANDLASAGTLLSDDPFSVSSQSLGLKLGVGTIKIGSGITRKMGPTLAGTPPSEADEFFLLETSDNLLLETADLLLLE
jgi:hypothetical protein